MKYRQAVWSDPLRREAGALSLGPAAANHQIRIYRENGIAAETLDRVRAEFILQRHQLIRHIIKELDILLKVGGEFVVVLVDNKAHGSYMRSRDQVKNEFALSTGGRYDLAAVDRSRNDTILTLTYTKRAPCLPPTDSIARWTFGIITDGRKIPEVHRLVRSIRRQKIPDCEILVCGPYEFEMADDGCHCRVLPDVVGRDVRAPITAKKNRLIREARFNNLCILHDRFVLPDDWYARFAEYGNHFEILCLPTRDHAGHRFEVDWMTFSFPLTERLSRNEALDYDRWDPALIVQGGVIVAKKSVIDQYLLDERLHWEELEDIQFSKQAFLNGTMVNIDPRNGFISDAVHHRAASPAGPLHSLIRRLRWYRVQSATFVRFHQHRRKYRKPQ